MSQDFNKPSENQPATDKKVKKSNTWLYVVIIVVLLGTNVYLFLNKNSLMQQNQDVTLSRDSISQEKDRIQGEYDAAIARLDDLTSKNTALNSEITEKDTELQKLKEEIKSITSKKNATAADLSRARTLIAQLNTRVKGYEERIAALETENQQLNETNSNVTRQRDSTAEAAARLKSLGSVLHASNIRMVPIDLRRGGKKEKETEKAKRVDLLRIYFDIDENRIAESGNKDLFLKITAPDGVVLSNAAYGSGITTDANGASLNYTLQKTVSLVKEQPVNDISVDWKQDSDYKKGSYKIDIYNAGYQIGSGTVTLK